MPAQPTSNAGAAPAAAPAGGVPSHGLSPTLSDAIRGMRLPLLLGPLLVHACLAPQRSLLQYVLARIIGDVSVPAFFFVSGLLYFSTFDGTLRCYLRCERSIPKASAALIIGFAGTLPTLLTNGKIMHTVIYWLSIPISKVGPAFGAVLMFWANLIINLFIPSGSGQAAAVMPIMVPIADMCGITRQVAVQAFQFGDGISNNIVPTAGTLMGCLAVADMNYGKFAKWGLKLLLAQIILASIALFILQSIGWTGV